MNSQSSELKLSSDSQPKVNAIGTEMANEISIDSVWWSREDALDSFVNASLCLGKHTAANQKYKAWNSWWFVVFTG